MSELRHARQWPAWLDDILAYEWIVDAQTRMAAREDADHSQSGIEKA